MHLIKPRLIAMLGIGALVALASTSVATPLTQRAAAASYPTVLGAGSTWVQIALDQWRADIARQGFQINYQGVGSSAGREFYINNQVDFAASEIPFQPDELPALAAEHKAFQYIPDVAGGTSLMYNIDAPDGVRINNLRLDADAAGKIFTGVITTWQNPEIQALNPGLQIEQTTITPVVRSDGSGTSAQFSLYLQNQAPTVWNSFASHYGCPAPCSIWPPFPGSTQQNGSDGVADFVADNQIGEGSIGYVEAGYAYARGFPVVDLENHSGNFTQPTATNVATALRHATLYPDFTQNLIGVYNAPEFERVRDVELQLPHHAHIKHQSGQGLRARDMADLHRVRRPARSAVARLFTVTPEPCPGCVHAGAEDRRRAKAAANHAFDVSQSDRHDGLHEVRAAEAVTTAPPRAAWWWSKRAPLQLLQRARGRR